MTAHFSTLLNGLWLVTVYRNGVVVDQFTARTWKAAEYKAMEAMK